MNDHGDEAVAPPAATAGPLTPDAPLTPEIVDPADPFFATEEQPAPIELTVEDLIEQLEQVTAERDGHFDARARLQAEFDNYRKRMAGQQAELLARAAESLVSKLLAVLDACDAALDHGAEGVEPIAVHLLSVLEREGLVPMTPLEQPFDPEFHEAVIHEPGEEGQTTVVDVLRTGYLWKNRVIRPAMVKVRG